MKLMRYRTKSGQYRPKQLNKHERTGYLSGTCDPVTHEVKSVQTNVYLETGEEVTLIFTPEEIRQLARFLDRQ